MARNTRYISACIFGVIDPERGTTAALVMPNADTQAMNAHLTEISHTVAEGAHAVLILDGAGWHDTYHLASAHEPLAGGGAATRAAGMSPRRRSMLAFPIKGAPDARDPPDRA